MSNLLLWENVASVPLSTNETDDDNLYLKEFFDHARILLHNISKLNTEMRKIYVSTSLISSNPLSEIVLYPIYSYHEPNL